MPKPYKGKNIAASTTTGRFKSNVTYGGSDHTNHERPENAEPYGQTPGQRGLITDSSGRFESSESS